MRAIRLSFKAASELRAFVSPLVDADATPIGRAFGELVTALRRVGEVKPAIRERRKVKAGKKETRRERFSAIRKKVEARAGGVCECGCGLRLNDFDPGEADHFFGKARAESLESVWLLSRPCHRLKTISEPSARYWLETFIRHCDRHTYVSEAWKAQARLDSLGLVKQASVLSEPKHISTVDLVGDGVAAETWRSFQKGGEK